MGTWKHRTMGTQDIGAEPQEYRTLKTMDTLQRTAMGSLSHQIETTTSNDFMNLFTNKIFFTIRQIIINNTLTDVTFSTATFSTILFFQTPFFLLILLSSFQQTDSDSGLIYVLVLLLLNVAVDTVNHNILLEITACC